MPTAAPSNNTRMERLFWPAPTEKYTLWLPASSILRSYSSHSLASVQPTSQVPPPFGFAGPISTALSLSQVPSCAAVVSLKRTKSSDSTVKGRACASPLEELLELEDEDEEDEELEELTPEELELLELITPVDELEDELDDDEELEELLPTTPLLDDDELELLLEELELLELLELDDEPSGSSPWVTKRPSPPQADSPLTTSENVSARRDLPAAP